jgi:hypothetical protein
VVGTCLRKLLEAAKISLHNCLRMMGGIRRVAELAAACGPPSRNEIR